MNTTQAYATLDISNTATFEEVKKTYRKLVLEYHPDKNNSTDDQKFKKITEAYHFLKKHYKLKRKNQSNTGTRYHTRTNFNRNTYWGAHDEKIPEQDWSKFTWEFEENSTFWKEYEKKFWEEYNAAMQKGTGKEDFEKVREPEKQPNLLVDVDPTLCIGCCSCETIAPEVFLVNKNSKMNPKSKVINSKGAGINKIMNAAQTCPTKAINVENKDTREKLYPI